MLGNLFLKLFTWWNGATIGTWFFTLRKGKLVGEDSFGNKYYKENKGWKRWVIYKGYADASSVPAGWHGWLHYRVDDTPDQIEFRERHWHKEHQENKTGTHEAYRPTGSILRTGRRPVVTGDYESWSPDDS